MKAWETAKVALKKILPEGKYRLWIDPLSFVERRGAHVVLECQNEFFRKRVRDNFICLIEQELGRASGMDIECVINVASRDRKEMEEVIEIDLQRELPNLPAPGRYMQRDMTFDQFVTGDGNKLAFSASLALAAKKSMKASALYLMSKIGLGKTHLSQAIGHHILTTCPTERIYYISADDFSNEMVQAFRQNRIDEFKKKYRKECDVLILDNIHHLQGKEKTQIELALTLDNLMDAGKRIIFSSCYFPVDIPKLNAELRSRLACGLIAEIYPPDYITRVRILQKKANGSNIPKEVIDYLAADLTENVRQLEAGLIGVTARSSLLGAQVDMEMAQSVVKGIKARQESITPEGIKKLVCKYFSIGVQDIAAKTRKQNIVRARQIAVYLMRMYTDLPLQKIGQYVNRNHATALHSLAAVDRELKTCTAMKRQLEFLREKLEGGSS